MSSVKPQALGFFLLSDRIKPQSSINKQTQKKENKCISSPTGLGQVLSWDHYNSPLSPLHSFPPPPPPLAVSFPICRSAFLCLLYEAKIASGGSFVSPLSHVSGQENILKPPSISGLWLN